MTKARFIYDIPDKNADLYYATGFKACDAVIFFEVGGRRYLVLSDLEFDRGRRQSKVDHVLSLAKYDAMAKGKNPEFGIADTIHEVLSDHGIDELQVPVTTSFTIVDALRGRGYRIEAGPEPFYQERYLKTKEERRHILEAQRVVFAAIRLAREILAKSRIKGRRLVYRGSTLTSERLRSDIEVFLLERGFIAPFSTIVSGREHALDPHDIGSGPLAPYDSIIVDVGSKSTETNYCGDATRTFCRGRAPDALRDMYGVVKAAQEMGIRMVKDGASGREIHASIQGFFAGKGYQTGEKGGRRQGFIHGTGHSIGLDVHEEPLRINPKSHVLRAGNVMSVEPGLYYKGIGGVRIEDLVYVTRDGCDVLASFPKQLEIF